MRERIKMNDKYDVIIIGAGPSGLSSGIQLAEFGSRVVALDAESKPGGVIRRIKHIDYYPGFPDGISSSELIERMIEHGRKSGLVIHTDEEVTSLSLRRKDKLVETTKSRYSAEAVIIASGSPDGEEEGWFGSGIFYCIECCKDFLRGRDLILIGSTSKAKDESMNLTDLASHVTLVNQTNSIPLTREDRARLNQKRVNLVEDRAVVQVEGESLRKLVTLRRIGDEEESTIKADGVVIISELKPIVEILRKEGIKTHRQGCIFVDKHGRTNVNGVFAAGPCTSVCKVGVPLCVGEGTNVAAAARFYLLRGEALCARDQVRMESNSDLVDSGD
jgi:thioredoxin reductase (NADPH)